MADSVGRHAERAGESAPERTDLLARLIAAASQVRGHIWIILAGALICALAVVVAPDASIRRAAVMAGLTLSMIVVLIWLLTVAGRSRRRYLEARLMRLLDADPVPCFSTDSDGIIGFANPAARAMFGDHDGVSEADALSDRLWDLFASPPSVLYRLQRRCASEGSAREDVVTRRGHTRLSVHRLRRGRYLWRLEDFGDHGLGRAGRAIGLPMIIVNAAGLVLFSNDALRRLTGSRPRRLSSLFGNQILRSGEEVEVSTVAGPSRAILGELSRGAGRREIYLLPVAAERPLSATMTDFENLPVALLKFAPDGTLCAANRATRDLIHIAADATPAFHEMFEGLGRPVSDWLADVLAERIPSGAEVLRLRQEDGDSFYQITLRRTVEHGRPVALAVLNDATALKTLEAQFVQSQKMQAIGQLAGGIAHDFNNLLTAISGHCDLLMLRHDRDDPDYAELVQINQNANRAASLVGQLLAFSRKQTLRPARVDLQEVLSDLTHLLNRLVGERINLRLAHASELGHIRADKRQLEQVVMNLVVNARDAMPEGGTIRIETEAVFLEQDLRRDRAVVPAGDYAVIRVLDTGCGIPTERLQKVFEPFFTTKKPGEGTGLGLSTAYGIVKQSGGYIFVDSVVGQGTIFHLYFPINETPDTEDNRPQNSLLARSIPKKTEGGVVLLVEDEAPVRAFAARALRLRGYTVLEADCAEAALRILEDPALEIDIFVTDVVMPGMDGPGWVRIALEARPNVRTIFVSGYAEDCLSEYQARIPNSVFLAKPFSLSALTETVQSQID